LDNVNNLLMQLRKLCNHPYLVLEDVKTIPDELYYEHLLRSSGKLYVLDKLLTRLLGLGCRVLIFCQMTSMLDILQGYLQDRGLKVARLDGSTEHAVRERQLRDFNRNHPCAHTLENRSTPKELCRSEAASHINAETSAPGPAPTENSADSSDYSVFLLSTRAGGVGINLQSADTVILFDSDWNPQQDLQAISRAHRIGQTKPVLVLRLVSIGPDELTYSVEQRILRRAARKLEAERQVLARGLFDQGNNRNVSVSTTSYSSSMADDRCGSAASSAAPEICTAAGDAATCAPVVRADSGGYQECDNPAEVGVGDSLLSLFETITDTESVSSADCSFPFAVPRTAPSSVALRAATPTNRTSVALHAPLSAVTSKKRSALGALMDMYALDFSESGIERICQRDGEAAESAPLASADREAIRDNVDRPSMTVRNAESSERELIAVMKDLHVDDWRAWLYPDEPRTTCSKNSLAHLPSPQGGGAKFSTPPKSTQATSNHNSTERRSGEKRQVDYNEDSLWATVRENACFVVTRDLITTPGCCANFTCRCFQSPHPGNGALEHHPVQRLRSRVLSGCVAASAGSATTPMTRREMVLTATAQSSPCQRTAAAVVRWSTPLSLLESARATAERQPAVGAGVVLLWPKAPPLRCWSCGRTTFARCADRPGSRRGSWTSILSAWCSGSWRAPRITVRRTHGNTSATRRCQMRVCGVVANKVLLRRNTSPQPTH
jgi:hypothetical protein